MTDDPQRVEAFDALEDALAVGFRVESGMVRIERLAPLMEAASAVLMIERGVEPLMPRRSPHNG